MNVLLLEDDAIAAANIQEGLEGLGHSVTWCDDGLSALASLDTDAFDVAIVDRMVPGLDGLSLVRLLREQGKTLHVLMLTALGGVEDRVDGLDSGADDYLVKPFAFVELVARMNALNRRPQSAAQALAEVTILRAQDIEMNLLKRDVTRAGRAIDLQPRDFLLLEQLLYHSDRVVTKMMLLETVWNFDFDPRTNVVETQVSRLRMKLNEGFERDAIRTIRGAGYMISTAI